MEENGPGKESLSSLRHVTTSRRFVPFGIRRFNPDNFGDTGWARSMSSSDEICDGSSYRVDNRDAR